MSKKAVRELRERLARAYPFVPCGCCTGGWVYIVNKIGDYVSAERCSCHRAHQAKIQRLLGERTHV